MHPLTTHALAVGRIQDRLREAEDLRLVRAVRRTRTTWLLSMIHAAVFVGRVRRGVDRLAQEGTPGMRPLGMEGCGPEGRLCV